MLAGVSVKPNTVLYPSVGRRYAVNLVALFEIAHARTRSEAEAVIGGGKPKHMLPLG
jgi:hypothetical protein